MPEGDTIHRAAAALRTALVDQKMIYFEAPRLVGVVPRAGRTIERVESHGKHLEMEWDDGVILHTHMRMSGSWHLYRTGQSWQRNHREVRALVEVEGWVAVCFSAPVVETYRRPDASRHPGLRGLGPDLCRADADLRRCVDALLAYEDSETTIAELLLDQRVFCGVGNVYRCEVLWVSELSPFARVATSPRLKRSASSTWPPSCCGPTCARRAGHDPRRAWRPRRLRSFRAAVPAVRRDHLVPPDGEHARILYWCPGCQVRHDPRRPAGWPPLRHPRRWTRTPRRPASSPTSPGAAPRDDRPVRPICETEPTHFRTLRSQISCWAARYSVAIARRMSIWAALRDGYSAATRPASRAPMRM